LVLYSGRQKHCHIRKLLKQENRISKRLLDIAEYILQHGNGLIWQGLHQISQRRQFPETRKVLTHVQLNKGGFHCDHLDGPKEVSRCQPVSILSEQRIRRKPQGLGARTAIQTTQQTWPTESTCSHKCQDVNEVLANGGDVQYWIPLC
jgi:hypothetical protein